MKTRKIIGLLLVTALIISLITGCGKSSSAADSSAETTPSKAVDAGDEKAQSSIPTGHTADTVKIGFVDVTGSGLISDTLGVARDQGFIDEEFKKIGVKAELVPMTGAGPAINEALASKNLDVGFLGDVPAIIGKAAGVDTQLISNNGLNSGASLVVTKGAGYKSVKDLKGKKIATQKGAFMHKVLIDILAANGLTIDDIKFINVNAQGAAEAFIAGNVDGVVVGGSTLTNLVEGNYGDVLVDYREHPEWNCGGYGIARTQYIKDNPDIILALVKALVKAQQLAKKDDSVLLKQWLSTKNSESSYEYLYPKHDNYYAISSSDKSIEAGNATIKFLLDNKLVANGFEFKDWINSTFYEEAYKELGISE